MIKVIKVLLDNHALENALYYIGNAVLKSKSARVELQAVEFKFENGVLTLYSSDGVHFCESTYGEVECEDNIYFIEYAPLYKIVSSTVTDNCVLEFGDTSLLLIAGKSEYTIQYMNSTDYSYIFSTYEKSTKEISDVDVSDLNDVNFFISPCIAKQTQLSQLAGVYFDGNFVATDSTSVAFYPYTKRIKNPLFLTQKSFKLMVQIGHRLDTIQLVSTDSKFFVVGDNIKYVASLMAGSFPNYKIIFDKKKKHLCKVIVDKDELQRKLRKLASISKTVRNPATLKISSKVLIIESKSEKLQGKEVLDIESYGITEEISIVVNLKDFNSYISHTYTDNTITLTFGGSLSEYVIEDGKAFYVDSTLQPSSST